MYFAGVLRLLIAFLAPLYVFSFYKGTWSRIVGYKGRLPLQATSGVVSDADTDFLAWKGFSDHFVESWRSALRGNSVSIEEVLSSSATWSGNPISSDLQSLKGGWSDFSSFFQDPAVVIFDQELSRDDSGQYVIKLRFQLSFWYPMPWRPRIIIPGHLSLTCTAGDVTDDGPSSPPSLTSVVAVKEKWDVSVADVLLKQLPPRAWDVWHIFSSPTPEYPPLTRAGKSGNVEFLELPETMAIEFAWSNLAKYPAPPLTVVPSFALFGQLRTSKPRRDPYFATMPVEAQSVKMTSGSGTKLKQSSWVLNVPSCLQEKVYEDALAGTVFQVPRSALMGGISSGGNVDTIAVSEKAEGRQQDDLAQNDSADYMVRNAENLSVMKSITGGRQRADFAVDVDTVRSFEEHLRCEYRYMLQPRRRVAAVTIKGEVTSAKTAEAVTSVTKAVRRGDADGVFGRSGLKVKVAQGWGAAAAHQGAEAIGFQLMHTKGCFNAKGEPAIAVYEMQYKAQETRVFVELE